jgi:hypothetical protein
MRWFVLLVLVASGSGGCVVLHGAMERQIGIAENCNKTKVLDQSGGVARVDVCGKIRTCRWSDDAQSWACDPPKN